jgi:sec-independent protein translocase protein TatC
MLNKFWDLITLGPLRRFMGHEPESHSIGEIFTAVTTEAEARAFLVEEIEKFRGHLLRSIVAVFIASGVAWIYIKPITEFLATPIGGQKALHVIDLTEGVSVYLKVTVLVGLAIAIIYIAFEFWVFAAPGLKPRERWVTLIGIPLSALLFWMGMAFTYFEMLPTAISFLLGVGDFQNTVTADKYYTLITRLMLWIGLFFEFPLVTTLLSRIGWIAPQTLLKQWRLAIVIIGIIAAVITPTTDIGSMALVMAPMIGLYFISILLSFIVYPRKKTETPAL